MMTPIPDETLSELIAAYVAEAQLTRELLPSTLRTWGPNLRAFVRWLEKQCARPPTALDWQVTPLKNYAGWLQIKPNRKTGGDGLRPRTINSHIDAFVSFGKWLVANNYAEDNPAECIQRPDNDQAQQTFLYPDEVDALYDACDRLYPPRHRKMVTAVLSVFFCTGLRYEDVRGFRLRNVILSDRENESKLVAEHSKGNKEFVARIPLETVQAIEEWLQERSTMELNEGNDWLWTITSSRRIGAHWWKEVRKELQAIAGIDLDDRLQAHAARRAFATSMDDKGVPMSQIQEMLGHEHIETTILYINKSKQRRAQYVPRQGWKASKAAPPQTPSPPAPPPASPPPLQIIAPAPVEAPTLSAEQEQQLQEMQLVLKMWKMMKGEG